ncbi:MAG: hypothetical protein RLY21_27 [Planctomycetota bacterium]
MDDGSSGWNGADGEDEAEKVNNQDCGDALAPIASGGGISPRPDDQPKIESDPTTGLDGMDLADLNLESLNLESLNPESLNPGSLNLGNLDRESKASHTDPAKDGAGDGQRGAANDTPTPSDPAASLGNRVPIRATPAKQSSFAASRAERRDAPLFQVHSLSNFLSTSRIPQQLDTLVAKCLAGDTRLDHILIHGAPGSGTGLLAVALINDYAPRRVIEIDAALGCDPDLLRRSIEDVGSRGVLFIRHIDALEAECDQMLAEALSGRPARARRPRGFVDPTESELDREISASATGREQGRETRPVDFTLVATAHMMAQVGYVVRTRVEHMFYLRDDPKALRNSVLRALRRHGSIGVDASALPQLERVLKSLSDAAEPITRATLLRSECDGARRIDAALMQSILEEDLAARLPDEAYSSSLRRHLGGRKIEQVTPDEIARLAAETGWGPSATEGALSMMIREEARKRPA